MKPFGRTCFSPGTALSVSRSLALPLPAALPSAPFASFLSSQDTVFNSCSISLPSSVSLPFAVSAC
eukprot:5318611-Pleurochrysis_carterae.AAC.1